MNMRKTIDLTKDDIKLVENYKKRHGYKNFSEAIREIIKLSEHIAPKEAGEVNHPLAKD